MGVHPFGDPDLADDFERVTLPLDATGPHEYAAEWTPDAVTFFVDGGPVKRVEQSPAYPMQLMLGIYEFRGASATGPYPKRFTVESLRVYRPRA